MTLERVVPIHKRWAHLTCGLIAEYSPAQHHVPPSNLELELDPKGAEDGDSTAASPFSLTIEKRE